MATITNIVRTLFTSSNSTAVEADFIRLSRAQTRLGQSSVSAGRLFAAQASGLGGLVAAYAGAAATSFALTAAFDALARSARAIQTIEGVTTLAAGIAQSGDVLIASIQKITKGQLTLSEAAQQTNLALSAGFSTTQIEALSGVAMKASRALGRDLTDSMTRVVRGSAKMEAELLDELGIYTKIDPATRAYAAAIGKTVSALSEFERRQAFANAVIEEGQRKFASINTTIPTSAEQIESLGARLSDLAMQLGGTLADLLAPIAGGIVDNIAASFGALGLVLALVASKGVSLLSASIEKLVLSMEASIRTTENKRRARLGLAEVTLAATNANKALTDSVLRLNAAEAASFVRLRDIASTRALSGKEIKQSNKLLNTNLQLLQAERTSLQTSQVQADRQAIRAARIAKVEGARAEASARATPAGAFGSQQFRDRTMAINAAVVAQRRAVTAERDLTAAFAATRVALVANIQATRLSTSAIQANTAAITGWRAAVAGLQTAALLPLTRAIGNLGTVFGKVLGAATSLFLIISIFQLIGSAIANALGKGAEFNAFFSELGSVVSNIISGGNLKEVKKSILGITGAALTEIEKVDSAVRNTETFSFRKKSFLRVDIQVEKTKEQLVKEVSSILLEVGEESGKTLGGSLTSSLALSLGAIGLTLGLFLTPLGAAIGGAIGTGIGASIDYFFASDAATAAVEKYGDDVRSKFGKQLAALPQDVEASAIRALSVIQDKYGELALIDPGARAAKILQEELIFGSVESLRTLEALGQVIAATGTTAGEINKNFKFTPAKDGLEGLKNITVQASTSFDYLSQGIINLGNTPVRFLFIEDMNEDLQSLLETVTFTAENLNNLTFAELMIKAPTLAYFTEGKTKGQIEAFESDFNNLKKIARDAGGDIVKTLEDLDPASAMSNIYKALGGIDFLRSSLGDSYAKLAGPLNAANRGFILTSELLRSTGDELSRGALTLEKFTQNTSNAKTAIIESNRALEEAKANLPAYEAAVRAAAEPGDRTQAEALLAAQVAQIANLEEVAVINKTVLNSYLAQEDSIARQIELTSFLKEQGKGTMSDTELEFALIKAGSEDATAASALYFESLLKGYRESSVAAAGYRSEVSKSLDSLPELTDKLKPEQLGAILTASKQSIGQLAQTLQDIPYILVDVTRGEISFGKHVISLVDQTSQDAFSIVELSTDAMKKLSQEALLAVISNTKKFKENIADAIADMNQELSELATDRKIGGIQFELDMLGIREEGARAAYEFAEAFRENQIKLVELQIDGKQLKPEEGAKEINRLNAEGITAQYALLEDEKAFAFDRRTKQLELQRTEYEASKALIQMEAEQTRAKIRAEFEALKATAALYNAISTQVNQAMVDGGNAAGQALVDAAYAAAQTLVSALGPVAKLLGLGSNLQKFAFTPQEASVSETITKPTAPYELDNWVASLSKADLAIVEAERAMSSYESNLTKFENAKLAALEESHTRESVLMDERRAAELRDFVRRAELLAQVENISILEAEKRLREAKDAGGGGKDREEELNEIDKKLQQLFDSIKGNIESAIMSLNDLIFYGEGNFGDIMGNLFKSIQQDFFKTTIADPLSTGLTDSLFGALGVTGMRTGIENARVVNGALMVSIVSGPEEVLGGLFGGKDSTAETGAEGVVTGFLGKDGTVANLFSNLFGEGGFLSRLLGGFGSFLGGILKAVFGGLFGGGMAQGGMVHLAAGGAASSSVLRRDRVPAMLEPGEFVLRKQSARKIGLPALQAMNATGGAGGAGNVSINVTNEGSAKQAEASQPRFDGEKYVVDVIMRDISNNGPIRRSLRSRGGL